MRGEEKERRNRECIPYRHIPDTNQTLQLVTHPPTTVVPTSREPDSLYNQGREQKECVYHFNYTCKCSKSLNRFKPEMTISRGGLESLNTYIHFKVLTQIIIGWYGKFNHGTQS
jgi:hypothetical protein